MKTFLSFALLLAVALTGCASFSKSGRQQRAYEKYVRKSSIGRMKQQSRFRTKEQQMPVEQMPSEPIESTETSPQALPSDGSE